MLLVAFALDAIVHFLFLQAADSPAQSFQELGNLFLWGLVAAVSAAVLVAIVRIKMQNRRDASPDHTSIDPSKYGDRT